MLYAGETVRLIRELPDIPVPLHTEGTVVSIVRNEEGSPLGANVNFYVNSKSLAHMVPLDSVQLVISSTGGCTGVFWGLGKPRQKMIEDVMHVVLDYGFEMREGINVQQLRYNHEDRFWQKQDRLSDPTGAQVVTAAPAWDGAHT